MLRILFCIQRFFSGLGQLYSLKKDHIHALFLHHSPLSASVWFSCDATTTTSPLATERRPAGRFFCSCSVSCRISKAERYLSCIHCVLVRDKTNISPFQMVAETFSWGIIYRNLKSSILIIPNIKFSIYI